MAGVGGPGALPGKGLAGPLLYTGAMSTPSPWMAQALTEAGRATRVSPNPAVGCVIVREGVLVGAGHTQAPGSAHAEVMALRDAGERVRGATVYVTLEPCSHWGRTPPCVDALIEAGVSEVHCAIADPDARVRGEGIARLRAAGLSVSVGDGAAAAGRQLAAFLCHRLTGRPLVTVKFAASLDGRIATRTGDARWISGELARAWSRAERQRTDAILVGIGTLLADNPALTARAADGALLPAQPLRVVLDSAGRTPADAVALGPPAGALIVTTARAPAGWRVAIEARGAETFLAPASADGRVALEPLLDELGRRGVLSLLVEGGGAVHGSFFDADLVDRVHAIIAPLVIGGAEAPGAVGGLGALTMAAARRLLDIERRPLGDDLLIEGWLRRPAEMAESAPASAGERTASLAPLGGETADESARRS